MNILIVTSMIPFVRGGAELLAKGLREAIRREGHECQIVAIPSNWSSPSQVMESVLFCRLLDLNQSSPRNVDLVIGLKFPAYFAKHTNKVLWMLHQYRPAYDLWDIGQSELLYHPHGRGVKDAITRADTKIMPEFKKICTISKNVSRRLSFYCGQESTALYHPPPDADRFNCVGSEPFFIFPSRMHKTKRQELVLEALSLTRTRPRTIFVGSPDSIDYGIKLKKLSAELGLHDCVEWAGDIEQMVKIDLFSRCRAVIFPPIDEDYGYVTLEAMLSSKVVVTCDDSGGVLEFVQNGDTGVVCQPEAGSLAEAIDKLYLDGNQARRMGNAAREFYVSLNITWQSVVEALLQ